MCLQVDEPAVWSELGHAQLDNGLVAEAIASYLRSNDTSRSSDVIERSKEVRRLSLHITSALRWCLACDSCPQPVPTPWLVIVMLLVKF